LVLFSSILARASSFSPRANFELFLTIFWHFSLLFDLGLRNKLSLKNLHFPTLVAIFICKNSPIYFEKILDL
jgi:hypothetical protein